MSECKYCDEVHEFGETKCAYCGKSACESQGVFYVLGSENPGAVVLCEKHFQVVVKKAKEWLQESRKRSVASLKGRKPNAIV